MSDPVGSKTFPLIVAGVAVICGLVFMVFRPDEEPEWPGPDAPSCLNIAISVVVMVGYAYALKPLGLHDPHRDLRGHPELQISNPGPCPPL